MTMSVMQQPPVQIVRTDSPDNDSAFSDSISLISSEQSSSSSSTSSTGGGGGSKSTTSIATIRKGNSSVNQ
ncbi:hypothetical protein BLA29_013352 [Euroglyphus maynei]|uniref:Uncharacterized protein n=1 Tax=Euroglyphus maynei TaxID=6958 RepID=A0A1Y3AZA6_EURMA|nr:hypothetical protein BLA29_013352 [Euroglyphus maynei]